MNGLDQLKKTFKYIVLEKTKKDILKIKGS